MGRTRLPPDLEAAVGLGGEAARTFAEFDWDGSPLGPVAEWPPASRTAVAVALASRFPVVLWLGDALTMVYNDGYIPMLADKHPGAMGTPGLEVWWEIRDIIEPMLAGVVDTGLATWSDDLLLMLVDRGRPWERYFTFTYSPIFLHEGNVGGVFCAVFETTERVLGERRLQVLHALGAALVDAKSVEETLFATVAACAAQPADLPFVALYLDDGAGQTLRASTPNVSALL
ncbi:MAG: SpoIIE family protein phosphatase, partial [Acidimicrobiales bacterium]